MISYAVARRTGEIGIRVALGAERAEVLWMVLREVLILTLMGVGPGAASDFCRYSCDFEPAIRPHSR